jgi:putative DNA primase/helicase
VTLGSFESWAGVLGGILHVAGIPGFLDNAAEFYKRSDAEGEKARRWGAGSCRRG